jgi:parallel beta-helix repeat protein
LFRKTVSGILLFLLLVSTLTAAFNIQPVKASGTVYIRADGSIEGTDKITSVDNVTYTFIGNITDSIVVERSNIIIDGNGHILQCSGMEGNGFSLHGINNVTIQNTNIKDFSSNLGAGIYLEGSDNITLSGNNLNGNSVGIYLLGGHNNVVVGNSIKQNQGGMDFWYSSGNNISENDIAKNGYGGGYCSLNLYMSSFNLFSTNNITSNSHGGVYMSTSSNNNTFSYNSIANNLFGVSAQWGSSFNMFLENRIANNSLDGIQFDGLSHYNSLYENYITDNYRDGISFYGSSNNTMHGNRIASNNRYGVYFYGSSNNVLRSNSMANNGYNFGVVGSFVHDVDASNIVDGRPIYYWINEQDRLVPLGAGYVALLNCTRIIVRNLNLSKNEQGILLVNTINSVITQNNIANNFYGIYLYGSSYNRIFGNNVSNNDLGITIESASNNTISHNNFIGNAQVVSIATSGCANFWDDGYLPGGNYWSDYNGTDSYSGAYQNETGSDGLGDAPHEITDNDADRYPLMAPFSTFDAGTWNGEAYTVDIISNSTLSDFKLNTTQKTLSFNVTGIEGKAGFCRVTIPNVIVEDLWQGNFTVLLNGESWPFRNWTDTTNTYIYINYTHSEHEIVIVPEFPSAITLPLFMSLILVAAVLAKKRTRRKLKA